jgi:uncharacterized membrane protein YciS (DUF1049 family)
MSIIRTILWVLLVVALVIFSINNWTTVEVKIWENLVLETKIPALVVISFLLGLVPVWLVHYGTRWRLKRRINSLETAVRSSAAVAAAPNPDFHPTTTEDKAIHP